MKSLLVFTTVGLFAIAGGALAAPSAEDNAAACRRITMVPGVQEQVSATQTLGTRIQFPAPVKTWLVTLEGLWSVQVKDDSVWVRPLDANIDRTGLSVFLNDGKKYDFLVLQPDTPPKSDCVIVSDPPVAPMMKDAEAQTRAELAREAEMIHLLQDQLKQQQDAEAGRIARLRSQISQQATDKIKTFQYSLYTKYELHGEDSHDDQRLVSAVYDDGRFTYVRISTTAFGLPILTGLIGGDDAALQYEYDDLTGTMIVHGLFDHIRVKLGTHLIDVDRQG